MSEAHAEGATRLIEVESVAGVAVVRLDNPPVNSMADALLDELGAVLESVEADLEVGALVLTGTGSKAFAAGADLPGLRAAMDDPDELAAHTSRTRRVLSRLAAMRLPTIAGIQASAVGGGLELALCCDLAVADEGARLGLPEVGLGLIPGAGGTQRLSRRVGAPIATEMILGGRLVKAPRALEIGLISAVAPAGEALAEARQLAERLAGQPRLAVEQALRVIRGGAELDLDEALDLEREAFLAVLATADAREGVDAFIARRKPSFRHR
jgi:enoyl-CoA hydratase/carnithine racemase